MVRVPPVGAAVFADGDVLCPVVANPVVEADLRGDSERCTVVKCVLVKHDRQRPVLTVLRRRGPFSNGKGGVAVGVDIRRRWPILREQPLTSSTIRR